MISTLIQTVVSTTPIQNNWSLCFLSFFKSSEKKKNKRLVCFHKIKSDNLTAIWQQSPLFRICLWVLFFHNFVYHFKIVWKLWGNVSSHGWIRIFRNIANIPSGPAICQNIFGKQKHFNKMKSIFHFGKIVSPKLHNWPCSPLPFVMVGPSIIFFSRCSLIVLPPLAFVKVLRTISFLIWRQAMFLWTNVSTPSLRDPYWDNPILKGYSPKGFHDSDTCHDLKNSSFFPETKYKKDILHHWDYNLHRLVNTQR